MSQAKLKLRALSADETAEIERRANARRLPARTVERARIIRDAHAGLGVSEIARRRQCTRPQVMQWLSRFNADGLAGLEDAARSGRPATYTSEQVSIVVEASLTDPQTLNLPFGSWTLDRLAQYLNEQRGIAIKRSRIGTLLLAEGLRWRKQESWFGERVDPDFAAKRGRLKRSIRRPLKAAR
jgi:transposase